MNAQVPAFPSTEAEVSNALVSQKDAILNFIAVSEDAEGLEKADQFLIFATPLWNACRYSYKIAELRERIETRARAMIQDEETYLAACRKNCTTRRMVHANLARLRKIIGGVT